MLVLITSQIDADRFSKLRETRRRRSVRMRTPRNPAARAQQQLIWHVTCGDGKQLEVDATSGPSSASEMAISVAVFRFLVGCLQFSNFSSFASFGSQYAWGRIFKYSENASPPGLGR
jgi:hypothetical protein